jgi:UDP-N-acetyl-D-mannosaminuronate dehydrogenase
MSVAVIGLGRAGLPLAAVIAGGCLKVVGVDLDRDVNIGLANEFFKMANELGIDFTKRGSM